MAQRMLDAAAARSSEESGGGTEVAGLEGIGAVGMVATVLCRLVADGCIVAPSTIQAKLAAAKVRSHLPARRAEAHPADHWWAGFQEGRALLKMG